MPVDTSSEFAGYAGRDQNGKWRFYGSHCGVGKRYGAAIKEAWKDADADYSADWEFNICLISLQP
jgi:hypothetical protein